MSAASDAVRAMVASLLPGWRVQFGRWVDGSKTDRYAVIKPAGGLPAALVRQPQFTLSLIGALDESSEVAAAAADTVIEGMRVSSGTLVFMEPAEPVYSATSDGRPVFEIAISAITT